MRSRIHKRAIICKSRFVMRSCLSWKREPVFASAFAGLSNGRFAAGSGAEPFCRSKARDWSWLTCPMLPQQKDLERGENRPGLQTVLRETDREWGSTLGHEAILTTPDLKNSTSPSLLCVFICNFSLLLFSLFFWICFVFSKQNLAFVGVCSIFV